MRRFLRQSSIAVWVRSSIRSLPCGKRRAPHYSEGAGAARPRVARSKRRAVCAALLGSSRGSPADLWRAEVQRGSGPRSSSINEIKFCRLLQRNLPQRLDGPVKVFRPRAHWECRDMPSASAPEATLDLRVRVREYHDRPGIAPIPLYRHQLLASAT